MVKSAEGLRHCLLKADTSNRPAPIALRPANVAFAPSSSSMRSSWLYLQMRSVRLADPVLIWPAAVPTARSAIVVSSVSPERCEMIVGVAGVTRHADRVERFGDRADLIELDQNGVRHVFVDAAAENRRVGDEDVVPDELHTRAQLASEHRPAGPVAFGKTVLDGHDRILPQPVFPETHHLFGAAVGLTRLPEGVAAVAGPELARGRIERHPHVAAGREAGGGDGLEDDVDRLLVRLEIGREASLVADAG